MAIAALGLAPLILDLAAVDPGLVLGAALIAGGGFAFGLACGMWRGHRLVRDIGEQTLALRALFDAMPVRVHIKDRDLRFVYVNTCQAKFLGTNPERALGRTGRQLLGPGRGDTSLDDDVLRSGAPLAHYTERYTGADGVARDWLISKVPLRDRRRRVVAVGTIAVDVSERNALAMARDAAERRIAEVQAELATAIESLDDGLLLIDRDRRIVAVNSVMRDLYPEVGELLMPGTPLEQLASASIPSGLFPEPHQAGADDAAGRVAEFCAQPPSRELALADGRWLLLHNTPTATGGYCALRVDITRQKHIEFALQEAKEAAERANAAKSAFLANMSHELRTPLNAIIGFAEMIERGMFGPVGNRRYLGYAGDIRHAGQHLLSIINDVLDLSKIEAGHLSLREGVCRLDQIAAEAVRVVDGGRQGAELRTELQDNLPLLVADKRALTQILINLLSNARKFTPPDGRIILRARLAPEGGVELEVEDTGVGIAPQHLDTVLSPFGQIEGPLQRRHSGTGLGLPLARALAELHHGRLRLRSAPGQGTCVGVWLPARRLIDPVEAPQPQPQAKRQLSVAE